MHALCASVFNLSRWLYLIDLILDLPFLFFILFFFFFFSTQPHAFKSPSICSVLCLLHYFCLLHWTPGNAATTWPSRPPPHHRKYCCSERPQPHEKISLGYQSLLIGQSMDQRSACHTLAWGMGPLHTQCASLVMVLMGDSDDGGGVAMLMAPTPRMMATGWF